MTDIGTILSYVYNLLKLYATEDRIYPTTMIATVGGFLVASGLVHHTPDAPLLPRAPSGNGPASNFWAPVGFVPTYCTALVICLTLSPFLSLSMSQYGPFLFHTRPLPTVANATPKRCALAPHVLSPIHMSHLPVLSFSVGVSLYKWPL